MSKAIISTCWLIFTALIQNCRKYNNISFRYTVEWIGREGLDPETHGDYLQNFVTHFYRNIIKLVDRAMKKEDSSAQGQIITEILQHLHTCNNSVRVRMLHKITFFRCRIDKSPNFEQHVKLYNEIYIHSNGFHHFLGILRT